MRLSIPPRARLALAALLFSTGGAAIKSTTLTGWQVASFRSGVAALAVALMMPEARRGWTPRIWIVSVAYAVTLVLFVLANKLTTSANAIFLQSTAPLYIVFLSRWLLSEPVHRRDLLFLAPVAVGLVLFFLGSDSPLATATDPTRGNIFATLSGVTWAFTIIGLRWLGRPERSEGLGRDHPDLRPSNGPNPGAPVVLGNLIAFAICLPMALPLGSPPVGDWAVVGYLGVFQIGVAYVCVTTGLVQVPALEASLILLIEPVLNPVWSWALTGERPNGWALAGGMLILGATTLRSWSESRRLAQAT